MKKMADMQQQQPQNWRSAEFRQRVVVQIEEALRKSGNVIPKSSVDMESHIFVKAQTREEYLELVARLLVHMKEFHKRGGEKMVGQGVMPAPMTAGGQGLTGQMSQVGQGIQDPLAALSGMTGGKPANSVSIHQIQAGQLAPNQAGMTKQAQPFATYQGQQRPQLARQEAFVVPPGQPGLQQLPTGLQQGMQPGLQQTLPGVGQPGGPQVIHPNMQQNQQSMYGGTISGNTVSMVQSQPNMIIRSQHQGTYSQTGQTPINVSTVTSQIAMTQPMTSPASMSMGMSASPASMMTNPSPQSQLIPSPASRHANAGIPSPSSTSLNTPGNPASVGPGASPAPGSGQSVDDPYKIEQLKKQLKKYVEPLKRMIARTEKEEGREKETEKMKNLWGILSDNSTRQVSCSTLLKCEEVLRALAADFNKDIGPKMNQSEASMCQPLLEAINSHIGEPTFNHTLQRTFGPTVQALHGPPLRIPTAHVSKKRKHSPDPDGEVSNVLQGEIARLDHRFKVELDSLYHAGSKTVHLACRLDDGNLPSVPPLSVSVPENYPESSPSCNTDSVDYEATPFLNKVQSTLSSQLLCLPDKFSVTALLDTWEMSVRKACAPSIG